MRSTLSAVAAAAGLLATVSGQQFVMYTPGGDDTSVERADPMENPGTISKHVHQVFGSNAFSPDATYESLQTGNCTTVADAANHGNAQDNSIYWHPSLYMETKNGTGYIRLPTNGHKLYYKDAGTGTKRVPFEFPHGFRMLAGNPALRAAPSQTYLQNITQWICHGPYGMNQGTSGGFPTGVDNCQEVDGFNGAIHFPHCWNGQDFDPANPTAHVVYPLDNIQDGPCPASHPTRLPHLFQENTFNLDVVYDDVVPDSFVLSMGDNTGYGWHADFYNGWVDGAIPALLAGCAQGGFGNEDVGSCPSFEARSIPANECKLKTFFPEHVTRPGHRLPGCNPISDVNPAPAYAPAPRGKHCPASGKKPSKRSVTGTTTASTHTTTHASTPTTTTKTTTQTSTPTTTIHITSTGTTTSSPSTSPTPSCPDSAHQLYTIDGKTFRIQCGIDHFGGDLERIYVTSLADCLSACASTDGCVDVSLRGEACYLKNSKGVRVKDSGIVGGKLVTRKPRVNKRRL